MTDSLRRKDIFAKGSASDLFNLIVGLMHETTQEEPMWKERAATMIGAVLPALVFKRDREGLTLDARVVRENIELPAVVRLSRYLEMPTTVIRGLQGYLAVLPGYVDASFDDNGEERPPSPDYPSWDLSVCRQQHAMLSRQFVAPLQSLESQV